MNLAWAIKDLIAVYLIHKPSRAVPSIRALSFLRIGPCSWPFVLAVASSFSCPAASPSAIPEPKPSFLRELATDRPDQTESAHTVEPGRYQLELDFVNMIVDRSTAAGETVVTEAWSLGTVNLKTGLLKHVDLQCLFEPAVWERRSVRQTGAVESESGVGEIQTRIKWNLWGNDGGQTALALMPFAKWPLPNNGVRNGKTEGGLIVPFGMDWGGGWGMGAMTEVDVVAAEQGKGRDWEWVNSLTVGKDLTARWAMYVEFYSVTGTAPGFRWQGQADVGWTLAMRPGVQLDWGCNFGVTESAPDFNPFLGMSWKF